MTSAQNTSAPGWGEPAPLFIAPTAANPSFRLAAIGGRFIVLMFYGSAQEPAVAAALSTIFARRNLFDDDRACFFGVVGERSDLDAGRASDSMPGIRYFHDFDRAVAPLYGAADAPGQPVLRPCLVVLDRRLRLVARGELAETAVVLDQLEKLLRTAAEDPGERHAPVLIVPRVFEPALCRKLIEMYDSVGGQPSGFMRDIDGRTTLVMDPSHKRRSDATIMDAELRDACVVRVRRRLVPEIAKAFQFTATRIERYIVGRYDSESGGYFRPHRDNMTKGTAHRRFAVSLNLNTGEYDGGELRFPEFGGATYSPPVGGAVVFSCSLLHEATAVTSGRRYAFLPFLYDESAAEIRRQNLAFLAPEAGAEIGDLASPEGALAR